MAVFGLVGLAIIIVTLFSTEMYQQEVNQRLNRRLAEQIVDEKLLMQENRVNQDALADIFHMLMVINPSIELYLLSPRGEILAYSAPPGSVKRTSVSLEPIRRFLNGVERLPILGDDPRDWTRQKIFSVASIQVVRDKVHTVHALGCQVVQGADDPFSPAVAPGGIAGSELGIRVSYRVPNLMRPLSGLFPGLPQGDFTGDATATFRQEGW